jgi:Cu(I)/Ag(I) efflux system membrane fusion protein
MTAATDMQKAIAEVDMSLLAGDSHDLWMKALPIMKEALTKIAGSHDLQVQREGFSPLSQQVIALSKQFGALGVDSVFVMHCPMAFDNRGAFWLQDNEDLKNPYFGEMMLQCGSVEEVIPAAP